MNDDPVACARNGRVATITLDRPRHRNALTAHLLTRLYQELQAAEQDSSVASILLTAAGAGFCAGQDLNDRDPRKITWPPDLEAIQRDYFHPVIRLMASCQTPVVVAVNGVASGAGASLALAGDIVVAGESAKLILSFSKVGLSSDAGCAWHLTKSLGAARARALLLTGGALPAKAAADAGLIWQCVPDAELMPAANAIASGLASGPAIAHGLIKQAVSLAQSLSLSEYLEAEARLQGIASKTADYREGVLAFLEKRAAAFAGR